MFLARREEDTSELITKILDVGIAKVRASPLQAGEDHKLTKRGWMLGSPVYMSPEQAIGSKDLDARSAETMLPDSNSGLETSDVPPNVLPRPSRVAAQQQGLVPAATASAAEATRAVVAPEPVTLTRAAASVDIDGSVAVLQAKPVAPAAGGARLHDRAAPKHAVRPSGPQLGSPAVATTSWPPTTAGRSGPPIQHQGGCCVSKTRTRRPVSAPGGHSIRASAWYGRDMGRAARWRGGS